ALVIRVVDQQIGVGADTDGALARIETERARGILGEHARHPRERQAAVDDALAVDQRHQRLERWTAEGHGLALIVAEDVLPARLLELLGARRMVARDVGDVPLLRPLPQGVAIATGRRS